jgi:hypothetical protein
MMTLDKNGIVVPLLDENGIAVPVPHGAKITPSPYNGVISNEVWEAWRARKGSKNPYYIKPVKYTEEACKTMPTDGAQENEDGDVPYPLLGYHGMMKDLRKMGYMGDRTEAEIIMDMYNMWHKDGERLHNADQETLERIGRSAAKARDKAREKMHLARLQGYIPGDGFFDVQRCFPELVPVSVNDLAFLPLQLQQQKHRQQHQQHPQSTPQSIHHHPRTPFVNPLETHHAPLGANGIREYIPGQTHFRAEDFATRPDDPAGGYKWMKQREEMKRGNERR